jgi:hypothetical protein
MLCVVWRCGEVKVLPLLGGFSSISPRFYFSWHAFWFLPLAAILESLGILFFFWSWVLHSGPTPWSTPPALFCGFFFFRYSLSMYLPKLLSNCNTSYFAFWVARIQVFHRHPTQMVHFKLFSSQIICPWHFNTTYIQFIYVCVYTCMCYT